MEIFKSIINNWSIYQLISLAGMFIFVLLFILFASWVLSGKKKEFITFTTISLLSSGILTVLSFIILNQVFNESIRYIFLLTPIVVLFVEIISIGMLLGFFTSRKMHKEMDAYSLKKEMFKDSLQITVFIALLIIAFILSLTGTPFTFILLTSILSIGTIWINFLLVSIIFKDE